MSEGDGLSKLGIVLIIIFIISLLSLLAQLFYSLWRRRREINGSGGGGECSDHRSIYPSPNSTFSSKYLIDFLRIRTQTRLESDSIAASSSSDIPNLDRQLSMDLLMLQGRFLFTIKEEEREEWGSPDVVQSRFSASREAIRVDLAAENTVGEMDTCGGRRDDATPFSTPGSSPMYSTPSASPVFDGAGGRATGEFGIGFH